MRKNVFGDLCMPQAVRLFKKNGSRVFAKKILTLNSNPLGRNSQGLALGPSKNAIAHEYQMVS